MSEALKQLVKVVDLSQELHTLATRIANTDACGIVALKSTAPPAPASGVAELVRAPEFYADPNIYKPHPHGPAFDDRDKSDVARTALSKFKEKNRCP